MTNRKQQIRDKLELSVNKGELPDLFVKPDGHRIKAVDEWPELSSFWIDIILENEYGGLPPKPEEFTFESLCHSKVRHWPNSPNLWSYRISCHGGEHPVSFSVKILFPDQANQIPAIISGDGCWWSISDEVAQQVLQSGCALVMFNRTELAEDLGYPGVPDKCKRSGGLYNVFPGHKFGALSAWAWGYHRCVDLLYELTFVNKQRIAVTGHSRGGKTVLLAAMTDDRITLVNDNASGAGGSAAYRYVGEGGETLDIINNFPSWFGPGLEPYLNREDDLPFDQHCMLASIAPRPLLSTYALNDPWSNPQGMIQCIWAAGEVYKFLDAENNIAFHLRERGHAHTSEDWKVLLDFIAWKWLGKTPKSAFNRQPYKKLIPAFSWRSPQNSNLSI